MPQQDAAIQFGILALALLMDRVLAEPPAKAHPTVWMGKVAEFLEARLKGGRPEVERLKGALLGISVIALFALPAHFVLMTAQSYLGLVFYIFAASALLKTTLTIRSMEVFTLPIYHSVKGGDYDGARSLLRHVVRRDTSKLSEQRLVSATLETIAEGTVDGVTSPLFYYGLLGVPGAVAFRAINTLDSTVGYKDAVHMNIGWLSAKLDTVANYIPARITGLLMVLVAWAYGYDWRGAWRVLRRDGRRTESLNAGWSMSPLAGALGVQLEKPGFYKLGDERNSLTYEHIQHALKIMRLTSYLFAALVVLPLIVIWSWLPPLQA